MVDDADFRWVTDLGFTSPDQQWQKVFVGNSYRFLNGAKRLLDARIMCF